MDVFHARLKVHKISVRDPIGVNLVIDCWLELNLRGIRCRVNNR